MKVVMQPIETTARVIDTLELARDLADIAAKLARPETDKLVLDNLAAYRTILIETRRLVVETTTVLGELLRIENVPTAPSTETKQ